MKENEGKWKKMKENERKWKKKCQKMSKNERKCQKMTENDRKWKKKKENVRKSKKMKENERKWMKMIENERKNERKWKKNEKWFHTQNPRRFPGFTVVVVTFSVKILDDFHDFVSECVSFPRKMNNPFWGVIVFPKKIDNFHWTWNKNTHFTDENERNKKSLRSAHLTIIILLE